MPRSNAVTRALQADEAGALEKVALHLAETLESPEDPRLEIAYAIARVLQLPDWPAAWERWNPSYKNRPASVRKKRVPEPPSAETAAFLKELKKVLAPRRAPRKPVQPAKPGKRKPVAKK